MGLKSGREAAAHSPQHTAGTPVGGDMRTWGAAAGLCLLYSQVPALDASSPSHAQSWLSERTRATQNLDLENFVSGLPNPSIFVKHLPKNSFDLNYLCVRIT